MARKSSESKIVATSEIPEEVLGDIVLADLAQITADAKTHPDPDAQARILKAVKRIREIAFAGAPEEEEVAAT